MRVRILLLPTVLVCGSVLSGSAGGAPVRPLALLITSDRGGQYESYVSRLDGKGVRALPGLSAVSVSISPDGRALMYSSGNESWLQRTDGSRKLISGDPAEAAWTSDGSAVAYGSSLDEFVQVMTRTGVRLGKAMGQLDEPPSWSPDRRSLLFVNQADHTEIASVDADGRNARHIAGSPTVEARDGASSPDGSHIAFSLDGDLVVAAPDGSNRRLPARSGNLQEQPAWSPDGSTIAFAASPGEDKETIWVTNAAGGGARRVTSGGLDTHPVFSPDGTTIDFEHRTTSEDPAELYSVPTSGGRARPLATSAGVGDMAWAPSGATFAATVPRGRTSGIGLFTAGGHLDRLLTPFDGSAQPAFSPDGSSIAYARDGHVWLMTADGHARHAITRAHEDDSQPRWAAHALTYTITAEQDGAELDIADIATGQERTIAWNALVYGATPTWSSDRDRVAYVAADGRPSLCVLDRLPCTSLGRRPASLSWSPDGAELRVETRTELELRDRDGNRLRSIALGSHELAWSRDGTRAAVAQGGTLRLLDPRTGHSIVLARAPLSIRLSSAAWGPGDRMIAYERVRSPLGDTDVFTVSVPGGNIRRVTRPFPDGGSNAFVGWVAATPPRIEHTPRVRVIDPVVLAREERVLETTAEGDRIAYAISGAQRDCAPVHIAEFGAPRASASFDPCGGVDGLSRFRISGPYVAWVLDHPDQGIGDDDGQCLYIARLGDQVSWPDRGVACDLRNDLERPPLVAWVYREVQLAGSAGTVFATLSDSCIGGSLCPRNKVVGPGLVAVGAATSHAILKTNTRLTLLDADARRSLVLVGLSTLAVYATDGSLLRTERVRTGSVAGGALLGADVLALRPGAIDRFTPGRAAPVRSYPVTAGLGRLAFHGVAAGIAVYSVGAVLHALRLSDGVDVALWTHGVTKVADATPTPSGLVVGLQLERQRQAGIVGTVRWDDIFRRR